MSFEVAVLPDHEDYLMAPVLAGMCKYESLKDGTVDLCDIARMNEALIVKNENDYRANKAARDNTGLI